MGGKSGGAFKDLETFPPLLKKRISVVAVYKFNNKKIIKKEQKVRTCSASNINLCYTLFKCSSVCGVPRSLNASPAEGTVSGASGVSDSVSDGEQRHSAPADTGQYRFHPNPDLRFGAFSLFVPASFS